MDGEPGRLRAGHALDVLDREQDAAVGRADDPRVRDLAAALRIERRPVQDQLGMRRRPGAQLDLGPRLQHLVFGLIAQDRKHATLRGQRLVAKELGGAGPAQDGRVAGAQLRGPRQLRFRPAAAPLALLGERVLEPGEVRPHAVLRSELDRQVDREPERVVQLERDRSREHRRIRRQRVRLAPDHALRRGERDQRLLQLAHAGLEGSTELALLACDRAQDLGTAFLEVGVGRGHRVDDHLGGLTQERLGATQQAPVANGTAQDAAQDVPPAFVRGKDPVGHEEGDGADVVGNDLVAEALLLEPLGVMADQLAHPGVDRSKQVRVVVARDTLDDARDPLQPKPGVDAGRRQRRQAAVRVELELHEHEVPDLEPARAVLGVVRDAFRTLGQVGTAIEVDLGARSTGPDVGHPPPVLLVASHEVAPADQALGRQPDLVLPDRVGNIVGRVDGGGQAMGGYPQVAGQELPRPVDRVALEIVAEAPVAEHLEQRVMARRPADLLEVVVLAGHAQAALVVDGPGVVALLDPGQRVLELDHAGVGEQQCLVPAGHQARAGHHRVAALGEELDEPGPDLGAGQVRDRRVGRGGAGHPRNGSERGDRGCPEPVAAARYPSCSSRDRRRRMDVPAIAAPTRPPTTSPPMNLRERGLSPPKSSARSLTAPSGRGPAARAAARFSGSAAWSSRGSVMSGHLL